MAPQGIASRQQRRLDAERDARHDRTQIVLMVHEQAIPRFQKIGAIAEHDSRRWVDQALGDLLKRYDTSVIDRRDRDATAMNPTARDITLADQDPPIAQPSDRVGIAEGP